MKKEKNISPILITGVERSGTTIVAKIIAMAGVWTGITDKMYENKSIKNLLSLYYKTIEADPRGQYPLPDPEKIYIPKTFSQDIYSCLNEDKFSGKEPWLYKSSKISQTWKVWNQTFPEAKWIIVRRKPSDIVYSCTKTMFMNAFSSVDIQKEVGVVGEKAGWYWWVRQHEQLFAEMVKAGVNYKVVWPEDLVDGNYDSIKDILNWLNLPYDEETIKKDINPLLWKSRINKRKE